MAKKVTSIVGLALGVLILVIGIMVQCIEVPTAGVTVGSYMRFGADFYTEMYDVTRDVGSAINNAQRNVGDALESVCDAIGWLIFAIGLVDIAYFVRKMFDGEGNVPKNTYAYGAAPVPAYPAQGMETAMYPEQSYAMPMYAEYQPEVAHNQIPPIPGGWTCFCGKNHAAHESSCVCGVTKADVKLRNLQNG